MGIFEAIGIVVAVIALGLVLPRTCFVALACVFLVYVLGHHLFPAQGSGLLWETIISTAMVIVGIVMFMLDILTIKTLIQDW